MNLMGCIVAPAAARPPGDEQVQWIWPTVGKRTAVGNWIDVDVPHSKATVRNHPGQIPPHARFQANAGDRFAPGRPKQALRLADLQPKQ